MNKKLAELLVARVNEKWNSLRERAIAAFQHFEDELAEMRSAYGDSIVDDMQREFPLPLLGAKQPAPAAETSKPEKKAKKVRAKSRRRRKIIGSKKIESLTFDQVKHETLEVAKGFEKEEFTVNDIARALKAAGKRFDKGHVSLVLSKYLNGITVARKGERSGRGGAPPNIYQKSGQLSIKNYTKQNK